MKKKKKTLLTILAFMFASTLIIAGCAAGSFAEEASAKTGDSQQSSILTGAGPLYSNGIETSNLIALKSMANNQFLCADDFGNIPLKANRGAFDTWETFELVELGNNQVGLKSLANNKFVCADNWGNDPLIANRDGIGTWETFELVELGNNMVALKAFANNKFVCADNWGNDPLIANRDGIGTWETFELIYIEHDANWSLIWHDEFNGNGRVDENKWTYDISNGYWNYYISNWISGWGNEELQYYTDRYDNLWVSGGKLYIQAINENYGDDYGNNFAYTSGRINTKTKFANTYGRYEIRAKLPTGQGLWPACWLLPEDDVYGEWAKSGEIDIMEVRGSKPWEATGAIHFGGVAGGGNKYSAGAYHYPQGTDATGYHTYSVEWKYGEIKLFVDGNHYYTADANTNRWYTESGAPWPAPFDQDVHIILNLAVGGLFDGTPANNNIFPAVMEVDYVRVYGAK